MRRRLSSWLLPTLVGPFLSASVGVTLAVWLWDEPPFVGRTVSWIGLMLVANLAAFLFAVALTLTDWLLLLFRVRQPPTGARAWLMALLGPYASYGIWAAVRPSWMAGVWPHVWAVALTVVGVVLVLRLVFGHKPGSGLRFW